MVLCFRSTRRLKPRLRLKNSNARPQAKCAIYAAPSTSKLPDCDSSDQLYRMCPFAWAPAVTHWWRSPINVSPGD